MKQISSSKVRPLTAQEEIYWLLNWNCPIHPVLAAHVTGPTVPEQWRTALDALQKRHPFLSLSIEASDPEEDGTSRPFLQRHVDAPIPLRVVPRASISRWEAEVERELAMPFAPGQAPLLRAVLIYEPEHSILILSGCHSIADGTTFTLLFRDILTVMAGRPLEPLEFPRSAEELLGLAPVAPEQTLEADDLSSAPENKAGAPTVLSLQFDKTLTHALVSACREQGVTVHGALAASLVFATRRQAPEFLNKPVRFISPVNTREILGAEDHCGLYFASPQASFHANESLSFWEIARSVRQGVVDASTHEALLAVTKAMQGMIASGLTRRAAADMLHGPFAEDILLSNLGRTRFDSAFGHLRLESLWGPAVLAGLPEIQTVGVATTNDSLCLLLTSYEPIPRLLETVENIVSEVCAKTFREPGHPVGETA
jgi:hypothetical protein